MVTKEMIFWSTICIIGRLALTVVVVGIYNIFDTSPTKDDRCRGGHDF